jgi:hypothetical protein
MIDLPCSSECLSLPRYYQQNTEVLYLPHVVSGSCVPVDVLGLPYTHAVARYFPAATLLLSTQLIARKPSNSRYETCPPQYMNSILPNPQRKDQDPTPAPLPVPTPLQLSQPSHHPASSLFPAYLLGQISAWDDPCHSHRLRRRDQVRPHSPRGNRQTEEGLSPEVHAHMAEGPCLFRNRRAAGTSGRVHPEVLLARPGNSGRPDRRGVPWEVRARESGISSGRGSVRLRRRRHRRSQPSEEDRPCCPSEGRVCEVVCAQCPKGQSVKQSDFHKDTTAKGQPQKLVIRKTIVACPGNECNCSHLSLKPRGSPPPPPIL